MNDVREALLVLRAQAGDREALGELFTLIGPAILRHLRHILRNEELAEDVLQDVFVIVHRKIRWLRDPRVFRPWLYRIATRAAIRLGRDERTRLDQPVDDWAWLERVADDDEMSERVLLGQDAMAAIGDVSPASRAVLSLHYIEGLTLQESADALGVRVGTAKSRLSAGIRQLRRLFGHRDSGAGGR